MSDPRSSSRLAAALQALLAIACVGVAVLIGWQLRHAASSAAWAALWCIGVAMLSLTPRVPIMPLCVYVVIAYGTPRSASMNGHPWQAEGRMSAFSNAYSDTFGDMLTCGVLHWVALLGAMGVIIWLITKRHRADGSATGANPLRSWLTWALVAWIAWVGIAALASVISGTPWEPELHRHPAQYVDALAIGLIAACVLTTERRAFAVAAVIVATVCIGGLLPRLIMGKGAVALNNDLAAMVVIVLPLALMFVARRKHVAMIVPFTFAALTLLSLLVESRNRGAYVAAVAIAVPIVWIFARRVGLTLLVALPTLALAFVATYFSPVWDRFAGIWLGTDDKNSVTERLNLWRAGWRVFQDHPWFGVGPGNFHEFAHAANPDAPADYVSHNNFVQVAGETGGPGLVLYTGLFVGALVMLARVALLRRRDDDAGHIARSLFASLIAYLVVGLFISRQDLVLAYLLVGWAVGLCTSTARVPSPRLSTR